MDWWIYLAYKSPKEKPKSTPVLQYDKNGDFIQEFPSCRIAAKAFKLKARSSIADVCSGRRTTAAGYVWKYKKRSLERGESLIYVIKLTSKKGL